MVPADSSYQYHKTDNLIPCKSILGISRRNQSHFQPLLSSCPLMAMVNVQNDVERTISFHLYQNIVHLSCMKYPVVEESETPSVHRQHLACSANIRDWSTSISDRNGGPHNSSAWLIFLQFAVREEC